MKGLVIVGIVILVFVVTCGGLLSVANNAFESVNDGITVIIIVNSPVRTHAYLMSPQNSAILYSGGNIERKVDIDQATIDEILVYTRNENLPWGQEGYVKGQPFEAVVQVMDGVNDRGLSCEINSCHPDVIKLIDLLVQKSNIDYRNS